MDAGKTTFIKELLEQEYFDTGEKTLLLLCEDGDTEYEDQFCREHNVIIRWVKEEVNFTWYIKINKKIRKYLNL